MRGAPPKRSGRALPAGWRPGEQLPGERGASVIDDRMRGPGNGATTVWVYDERRRVRDDVASRLVALPFVGRVEGVAGAPPPLSPPAPPPPGGLLPRAPP